MENKKHIVAVNAVLLHPEEKKALVLKRSKREIAYPGKWAWPGGKVEKGFTIEETLEREIKEETGLETEGNPVFISGFTFVRPDGHNVVGLVFLAKAKTDKVVIDNKDFEEYKWITPADLEGLDHIEGMLETLNTALSGV